MNSDDPIAIRLESDDRKAGEIRFVAMRRADGLRVTVDERELDATVELIEGAGHRLEPFRGDGESVPAALPTRSNEQSIERPAPVQQQLTIWENAGRWLRAATSPHHRRKFLAAMRSKRLDGPVSLTVLEFRHQCCHGTTIAGERVSDPCPARYESRRGVFCTDCECPEYSKADISVDPGAPDRSKLAYPNLECPRKRYAAMRGIRYNDENEDANGLAMIATGGRHDG